mmetsp:Transcript_29592/g.80974  ORF Transcript_29592/g.80974 Transcript_29592/m.80974 type:complete len:240 (-) Transcript_29592:277-996(-)
MCRHGDRESSAVFVPSRSGQRLRSATKGFPASPMIPLLLCMMAATVLRRDSHRWAPESRLVPSDLGELAEANNATLGRSRSFLRPGSVYQNAYMTLWNDNGVPISVTLRVREGDSFELQIQNLNSVGGGSLAWMALSGAFGMELLPGAPKRTRLVPEVAGGGLPLRYNPQLFDRATAFALGCVQRMGGARMLEIVQLDVDMVRDAILVTPRATVLRMLWDEPVVLRHVAERNLWRPPSQ